ANATIICGSTVGAFAFVGAGAVVAGDVPPHALVVGVPAKQIGWVGHAGERLTRDGATGQYVCPRTDRRYSETEAGLQAVAPKDK
ncbi:MAG: oxidoreductase, partial [Alphaproteobacteria bacterium]